MTLPVALLLLAAAPNSVPANTINLRCGSHCLYISLKALDLEVASFAELEGRLGQPGPAGYSMAQLEDAARGYGAHTLGVQTNVENLRRRPGRFACVALIADNHFVNLANVNEARVHVFDPPRDNWVPIETLRSQWDGRALLIAREPLLAEEDLPWEWPDWLWPAMVAGLASFFALFVVQRLLRRRAGART